MKTSFKPRVLHQKKPTASVQSILPNIHLNKVPAAYASEEITALPAVSDQKPTLSIDEELKPGVWTNDIKELEEYFKGLTARANAVKLNTYTTVTDVSKFLDTHFATLKANNGNRKFIPYLNRLKDLKQKFDSI